MREALLQLAWAALQVTPNPDDPGQFRDAWLSGDVLEAIVGPFVGLIGPVAGVLFALSIGGVLFVYSGSMVLPIVVTILISGIIMPFMPPAIQSAIQLLIVVGVAWALYAAWTSGGQTSRL